MATSRKPKKMQFTLDDLLAGCVLHLEAKNMAQETITLYQQVVSYLRTFLNERGYPIQGADIERRHIQEYMKYLLETPSDTTGRPLSATTVDIRFRTLRAFFNWAVKDGWLKASPMAGLDRPKMPSRPKPHFDLDDLSALVKACRGTGYDSIRDTAILRFFMGTGARLEEVTNLTLSDVDLKRRTATITGKGSRTRVVRIGPKVAAAILKYLLLRDQHEHRDSPALWLGQKGPLSSGGIHLMLLRRGRAAGLSGVSAHKFRHTYAHFHRLNQGNLVHLEVLMGWTPGSPMSRYYGASAIAEEALEHADEFSVGEAV